MTVLNPDAISILLDDPGKDILYRESLAVSTSPLKDSYNADSLSIDLRELCHQHRSRLCLGGCSLLRHLSGCRGRSPSHL